ncbi:hypothetical protein HPB50_009539 [Hyalomma asiaticum]|uniref:Uncharacterized protein n=1 Tax=Hyalomma asiaticum TaxID=266040 RepID=A0ACB7RJZ6_HYAAI|nr:hypothetical protein HPB50_009539 [Hyalomma asiaticum]
MDKYRQLAQGIIDSNPMVQVAFSAILPWGQNHYRPWQAQSSGLCHLNDKYRKVNVALMQFCQESGFTFLDELVDNWPGYLSRDGVHPSPFGNKVLAEFLHREAFTMSMNLERTRIHQSRRDPQASTWRGWAQQERVPTILEADFPALGLHAFTCQIASGPSTAPAAVWKTSTAPVQRPDTDQLARTFRGAGFTLIGGVRVRCKGSKAWWTWDSLPSPLFYDTSVPSRGNTEGRLVEPKIPGRGASTTCAMKARRASQKHENALAECSSVGKGETSPGETAVLQAVCQRGDSEWKLVQSKKRSSRGTGCALELLPNYLDFCYVLLDKSNTTVRDED